MHERKNKKLRMDNGWDKFFARVSNCQMYPADSDAIIKELLDDMRKWTVRKVENLGSVDGEGMQFKLKLTFKNGKKAIFKPERFGIDYEKDPNQFFFSGFENPNAEIAAFHLDRLLKFRRAIPTVDRAFTVETDLKKLTPEDQKIIYYSSPANNLCIVGNCRQYCDTSHAVCYAEGKLRGSLQAWLPYELDFTDAKSPYKRKFRAMRPTAAWQSNNGYCNTPVKRDDRFKKGRWLLDLVDLSVFDFLTGNQDRHALDWFSLLDSFGKDKDEPFLISFDNGRAFSDPHLDDFDILAPLIQCCVIRPSTVATLLDFYDGTETETLGEKLGTSLKQDPTHPILHQKYLTAIDRRVEKVLQEVVVCLKNNEVNDVLMNNFDADSHPESVTLKMRENKPVVKKKQALEQNVDGLPRPSINKGLVDFLKEQLPAAQPEDTVPHHEKKDVILGTVPAFKVKGDPWKEFSDEISNCQLYKKDSQVVKDLLKKMSTKDVKKITSNSKVQFSMRLSFDDLDKNVAIFKPMRFDRNYETVRDHSHFDDFERHHAEIAAFHLDRLLRFRRVLPVVGRSLNIKTDLQTKSTQLIRHFFSPAGADCFYPKKDTCNKYCDVHHAFCGDPEEGMIEGSVQVWLPEFDGTSQESPYKKTSEYPITTTRTDASYCNRELRKLPPYNNGRRLLDLVDLHIFDYLTGNQDRDKFNIFKKGNDDAFIFVTENGKAFGNPHDDKTTTTILAPLTQCCIVRPSTVKTLLDFYEGEVSLGEQLDTSLKQDPLYPILASKYLAAVNRRVEIVLRQVKRCLRKAKKTGGSKAVFIDSFQNKDG